MRNIIIVAVTLLVVVGCASASTKPTVSKKYSMTPKYGGIVFKDWQGLRRAEFKMIYNNPPLEDAEAVIAFLPKVFADLRQHVQVTPICKITGFSTNNYDYLVSINYRPNPTGVFKFRIKYTYFKHAESAEALIIKYVQPNMLESYGRALAEKVYGDNVSSSEKELYGCMHVFVMGIVEGVFKYDSEYARKFKGDFKHEFEIEREKRDKAKAAAEATN